MTGSTAHTRLEAIARASAALASFNADVSNAEARFRSDLRSAASQAEGQLAARQAELRTAEAALAAAREDEVAACQRRVAHAQRRVDVATSVVGAIRGAASRHQSRSSGYLSATDMLVSRGRSSLREMDRRIDQYLRTGGVAAMAVGDTTAARASEANPLSALERGLARRGLVLMAVADANFEDNPIRSWEPGERANLHWAVDRWESVVAGVVANGGGRDDLAARDASSGADPVGMRQLANVYDLFMGDDPIALEARPEGGYMVHSGRHRLEVARQLGITHLPVRMVGGGR